MKDKWPMFHSVTRFLPDGSFIVTDEAKYTTIMRQHEATMLLYTSFLTQWRPFEVEWFGATDHTARFMH